MFLLSYAHNLEERGIPFLIFKSTIDTRDGEGTIHSRPLGDRKCIAISPEEKFSDFIDNNVRCIFVDEAQFLTKEQVDELGDIADSTNMTVMCFGLRTDFQTHLFEGSKRLFEIADAFEEVRSFCDCSNKNIYNARIDNNGNVITEGEQIEVGAEDKYLSMCRKCYKEKIKNNKI